MHYLFASVYCYRQRYCHYQQSHSRTKTTIPPVLFYFYFFCILMLAERYEGSNDYTIAMISALLTDIAATEELSYFGSRTLCTRGHNYIFIQHTRKHTLMLGTIESHAQSVLFYVIQSATGIRILDFWGMKRNERTMNFA